MSVTYTFSVVLLFAGLMGSISMSLIPTLFPNAPKWILKNFFYDGIILSVVFIVAAIYIIIGTEEEQIMHSRQVLPLILIVICVLGFVLGVRWFMSEKTFPGEKIILEKARNYRLRNDLTQYLARGSGERFGLRLLFEPTVEEGTRKLIDNTDKIGNQLLEIQKWNFEVSCYIGSRLSEDRALWFYNKTPSGPYPFRHDLPYSAKIPSSVLESAWDTLTSNSNKIEQLLKEFPDIPGGSEAAKLIYDSKERNNKIIKSIHWKYETIQNNDKSNKIQTRIVFRSDIDIDNPIFDIDFDAPILSSSIEQSSSPPIICVNERTGINNYHFEIAYKLRKNIPTTVVVSSTEQLKIKSVRVALW